MLDLRRNVRYTSLARARLEGDHAGEAFLRDLSVTGCRLEFTTRVPVGSESLCRITVYPERQADVELFDLEVRPQWSRAGYDTYEIGFLIENSPKGRSFQRYVDYLSWIADKKAAVR